MNWLILTILFSVTFNFMNCNNNIMTSEKSKDDKEKNRHIHTQTSFTNTEPCNANKISQARLWSNYYNCLSRKTKKANSGQSPNTIVRAYVGSVVKLPCRLCVSPIERTEVVWMYAESYKNLSFYEIDEKEAAVINVELIVYYTRLEDQGVYRCKLWNIYGGLVLLEVTDEEKYTVVKPLSSHGPYPSPPEALYNSLVVFTHWSQWSECSGCDKVGRRRRYGICYVAHIDYKIPNKTENPNCTLINDEMLKLFHDHPKGIPCRSQMLPTPIGDLPEVQSRQNEIMIGLCKVPCKVGIFELRSDTGEIVERVNNTAGIFSLCQPKPLQPPQIARETMFALPGDKIFIRCPGTILRDIPTTWRIGNRQLTPRQLDAKTRGRAHLNARDHIVLEHVEYADANVYSCWQDNTLAGVVKLEISTSEEQTYRERLLLIARLILLILLLRFTKSVLRLITA